MNVPIAMRRRSLVPLVFAATSLVTSLAAVAQQTAVDAGAMKLILLDGQTVAAKSLSIADGKLSGDGVPAGLSLDDLRRIDLPGPATAAEKSAVVLDLRGGGRVLGKSATIGDDKCLIDWSHGEKLSLAIDVVRAIRFDPATANPEFDKAVTSSWGGPIHVRPRPRWSLGDGWPYW